MLLTVIIPAFNEEKIIKHTLNEIQPSLDENQDTPFSYEIIVCDNNSTDHTAEIANQTSAKVIVEPINQISRARNRGATIAQGKWLLFIDADSYPSPDSIADMLALMRRDDLIGCSSTIKVDSGPFWYRINLEGYNLSMRLFKTGMGLFTLCQADAFRAIGGFINNDFYAFEDLDFINRLRQYGRKQNKKYTVLHRHPVTTSGRKGNLYDRWTMTKSSLIALFAFLTKRKLKNPETLPFWYDGRR